MCCALPRTFFVQLVNTSRDNKKIYLFSNLKCLVLYSVFREVLAILLTAGHAHLESSQFFSVAADCTCHNDAVVLLDLHYQLLQTCNTYKTLSSGRKLARISGVKSLLAFSVTIHSISPPRAHQSKDSYY